MEQLAASATAQGSYFMQKGGGGREGRRRRRQGNTLAGGQESHTDYCIRTAPPGQGGLNPLRGRRTLPGGGCRGPGARAGGARLATYLLLLLVTLQRPGWLSTAGLIPAHAGVPQKSPVLWQAASRGSQSTSQAARNELGRGKKTPTPNLYCLRGERRDS